MSSSFQFCLNRTFMELKRVRLNCVMIEQRSLNRTFMELKRRCKSKMKFLRLS